jgi:peroxiredoxin
MMKSIFLMSMMQFSCLLGALSDLEKAPDFMLPDIEGNEFHLSDAAGKIVIIDFWATWCPPCQETVPHLNELQKEFGDKGLQVVGISLDRKGLRVVKPFAKKYNISYKLLVGDFSKVIEDYGGIEGIPTLFVIDRQGNIAVKFIGYVEKEELENAVKKLL